MVVPTIPPLVCCRSHDMMTVNANQENQWIVDTPRHINRELEALALLGRSNNK